MTAEINEEIRQAAMEEFGFGPNVMKSIKVCRSCGGISPVGNSFCGACGALLPEETVFQQYRKRHLYCTFCDTVLPLGATFCTKCGERIQAEPVAPQDRSFSSQD